MQTPAHNEATVNINYGGQAHKSFLHRNICDVNAPDLISMVNIQAPEQVWFDVGCASKLAQMLAIAHWHYALRQQLYRSVLRDVQDIIQLHKDWKGQGYCKSQEGSRKRGRHHEV